MLGGSGRARRGAQTAAVLGVVAQGLAIVIACVQNQQIAINNLSDSLMFLAWGLVGLYLLMERRFRIAIVGAFTALLAACLIVIASSLPQSISAELLPTLQSHWNAIHTITCLLGYSAFTLACGAAVVYSIQERMLKAKRINMFQKHLPSLDVADRLAYKLVSIGFPMLTIGIITGSLWAQSAWSSYWNWDPKETWSLITWLVYAAYLHVRLISRRRGKWSNRLLVIGFLCVLMTFVGVNLLDFGLHRYNW